MMPTTFESHRSGTKFILTQGPSGETRAVYHPNETQAVSYTVESVGYAKRVALQRGYEIDDRITPKDDE